MMSYVQLVVVMRSGGVKFPSVAKQKSEVAQCGGLIHLGASSHVTAAEKLSALPWVQRVVATKVQETSIGVWRNGEKM
jgi:hypothetical protein